MKGSDYGGTCDLADGLRWSWSLVVVPLEFLTERGFLSIPS